MARKHRSACASVRGNDRSTLSAAPSTSLARETRLAYFAHNVNHPDISRRVEMFAHGGAAVRLFGFHRGDAAALSWVNLGRTEDAKLLQRILSILKALLTLPRWVGEVTSADVIVARNLEMLIVAAAARGLGARHATLIYECLDIHRLMSGKTVVSRALRALERVLLRRVQGLLVSSPGFIREHFAKLGGPLPTTILIENKVWVNEKLSPRGATLLPAGPPWRIGWFGIIRCKRSLDMLIEAARRNPGLLEIVIAGRPASDVVGDLSSALPEGGGVKYLGTFADEAELARLYRSTHFSWLVDFYEAGANSDWLLPNRLYRSAYYDSVPIALTGVETGRWLEKYEAGLRLERVSAETIAATLSQFSAADYLRAKAKLEAIPTRSLVYTRAECSELVRRLAAPEAASFPACADIHTLDPLPPSAAAGV